MSAKYQQKFQVRFNDYFRKGRKRSNISYELRTLPKKFGGLGQLNTQKQMDLLRAQWVLRALADPSHLWAVYWNDNASRLQVQLGLHCPAIVAAAKWSKMQVRTSSKAKYTLLFSQPIRLGTQQA